MTIFYHYGNKLYINITNLCSNKCVFCVRNRVDTVDSNHNSLWLEHEPSFEEIIEAYNSLQNKDFPEIVFCGYGEPLERLDLVLKIAKYLKEIAGVKIRINTNGLSDLINGKPTAHLLEGLVDIISISLNAPDAKEYMRISRPCFGEQSFAALLKFAQDCKLYIPQVLFTVVDLLSAEQLAACKSLAQKLGIPLRIRGYGG